MALNKAVFKTRAQSAIVFVVVMLLGLLYNHWSFLLLFTIIHFGCWKEYLMLVEKIYRVSFHRFVKLGLMLTGFGMMIAFCGSAFTIGGYGLNENLYLPLTVAGFLLLAIGIFHKGTIFTLKSFLVAALGWLYISVSWGMMLSLRQEGMVFKGNLLSLDFGRVYPLLLILSIWANDTFAYLVGSFIGKTPFSPISPKKTWEGTIGGLIVCVLVMGSAGSYLITGKIGIEAVYIATIAGITGTAGDLLESKLKRLANVKDSGNMLPGHGGFMDRFDSLLIATPFVWLLVKYLF
ncbi:MAG: phosphatidate cytidylyltransferase [Bacteroidota bacterium]